jgi:hypothetical protein
MDAPDEAPDPFQDLGIRQLGRAPATAGEDREAEALVLVQRAPVQHARRHHRHLHGFELGQEGVLLQDGRVAPAPRAIELDDHRLAFFAADAVDAVFVAVQGQQATVAAQADAVDGLQHALRVEPGIRVSIGRMIHAAIVRRARVIRMRTRIYRICRPIHN